VSPSTELGCNCRERRRRRRGRERWGKDELNIRKVSQYLFYR